LTAYADTSFLFSLYFPDAHAASAANVVRRTGLPILSSELGEFEFTNAVCRRVLLKDLSPGEVQGVLDLLSKDVAVGIVHVAPISAVVFSRAKQIALSHTSKLGVRAVDILHVASALVQQADTFCTFDRNQSELAAGVGLKVL
jgi:predicted nucleic acid-binding protein